jgi:hypothetical protein
LLAATWRNQYLIDEYADHANGVAWKGWCLAASGELLTRDF